MDYKKDENGNLTISAATPEEQTVIDAIVAAIEAYKATLAEDSAGGD